MKKQLIFIVLSFVVLAVQAQDGVTATNAENPFSQLPIYYHFYPGGGNVVPDQSLFAVSYAKSLGFNVIEANIHRCSDGVYVTRHGNSGKLGGGLCFAEGSGIDENTAFKDITSTLLRENVTFDSPVEKYRSAIPTLEEFCMECKRHNMILFLQTIDNNVLEIARNYLPDERIIAYGLKNRGDFKGLITTWQNLTEDTDVLGICNKYGAPYLLGCFIQSSMSDEKFKEYCDLVHDNGYLIASAYVTGKTLMRLKNLGFDAFASTYGDVNVFSDGNRHNITSLDEFATTSTLKKNGDGSWAVPRYAQLTIDDDEFLEKLGKCCIKIKYTGEMHITIGGRTVYNMVSDGEDFVEFAYEVSYRNDIVKIKAVTAVTVHSIEVSSSIVPAPDVQTSVESVVTSGGGNMYYDICGRPAENPTRGIYIHNGKKVVVE